MATDLERLTVLIEANTRSYERSMVRLQQQTDKAIRGASKSIGSLDKSLKKAQSTAATFAKAFGAGFLVAGIAQIPGQIREVVRSAADLGDLAERIGLTTDALQELSFQASQAGASAEEMAAGLEQFSKRVGEASQGSGDLFKLFQANGVALRDAAGNLRPMNELLAEFANLVQGANSEFEQSAILVDGLGKAGQGLGLVFKDGAAGMALAAQKAQELNQVLDADLVQTAREIDDEFDALAGTIGTFIQNEVLIFVRDLIAGLDKLAEAAKFVTDAYTTSSQEARARLEEIEAKVIELQKTIAQDTEFGIDTEFAQKRLASLLRQAQELRAQLTQEYDPLTSIRTPGSIPRSPTRPTILPTKPPPGGGGGGGGGGRDSAADSIEREKEAVVELIAELERERELIGATDLERRISNELRDAGAVATEEQKAKIVALITAIEAEEAANERLIETLDEIRSAADSALSSFVSELVNAKGPLEALKAGLVDILNTIIRIAQQRAIAGLFGATGTSGGIFSGIASGLTGAPNVANVGPASRQSSNQAVDVRITAEPSPLLHLTIDQKSAAAEERAIARGPVVARNSNIRYAVP